ncbi:hsp70 family protein, partial [Chlamydia psittaci 06-1683]
HRDRDHLFRGDSRVAFFTYCW